SEIHTYNQVVGPRPVTNPHTHHYHLIAVTVVKPSRSDFFYLSVFINRSLCLYPVIIFGVILIGIERKSKATFEVSRQTNRDLMSAERTVGIRCIEIVSAT